MLNRGNLSRRGFMQRSLGALAATGLPLWYAREIAAADEQTATANARRVAANDKLNFGAIGIGSPSSRNRALYGEAKKDKSVFFTAACDVDARHLKSALEMFKKDGFNDAKGHDDFRKLLDDKDINAVTIATPDQWHALVAIEAMKRGKDVYCEKPLALTVAECQAIVEVQKKTGRVFQTGSQQRSEMGGRFRLAAEIVRSGRLGKISKVECRIGTNPQSGPIPVAEVPEGLNWDMWLGPTPKVPYRLSKDNKQTNGHYEFRWWFAYSGGKMTDWGAHHLDIAQWALGMDGSGPVSVELVSGTKAYGKSDGYDCPEHFEVKYVYGNGTEVLAQSDGENGAKFYGEDGKWLFVSRGKIEASDKKLLDDPVVLKTALYDGRPNNHMANFIDCIRTGKKPICSADIGASSCTICHIGVIAMRLGRKLMWDAKKSQFDDKEANAMLSREMRAPWKLEV